MELHFHILFIWVSAWGFVSLYVSPENSTAAAFFGTPPRKLLPSADLLPNSSLLPVTIGRSVSLGFLGGIKWELPNLWIPKMCVHIQKENVHKNRKQTKLPAPLPLPKKASVQPRIWLRVICYWKNGHPWADLLIPYTPSKSQIITLCQRPKTWLHRKNLSLDDFKGIFFH